MAKQIVAWCDVHLAQDVQTPGSPMRVALGDAAPLELDMCDDCVKELVEPLRLLVAEHGQPLADAEPSDNLLHCPMPGCRKVFTHGRNLQKHMERVHDTTLPDSVLGDALVVQSTTDDSGETIYPCPECDRTFKRPQGVAAHRSHVHGYAAPGSKGRGN